MPILVFLHGLLGSKDDWQKVIEKLPHFSCITLDLPFHGEASHYCVDDFQQTCHYLESQIQQKVGNQPYYLVGYSLGGRIALYYALCYLKQTAQIEALILEGANLGLETEQEKQQRWMNDIRWAARFAEEPISQVLQDWYSQPVFADLTDTQKQNLIKKRSLNDGKKIAIMLKATSLAKQPNFRKKIDNTDFPIYYFCGERDYKFKKMALDANLNIISIKDAGHNSHVENANLFSELINKLCCA